MHVPLNDLARVHAPHAAALRDAYGRVFRGGAFVLGNEVRTFEHAFAAYCGTGHCAGVANGSDALEIALRAVGVEAGDLVATVANAAMYATLAIRAIGAIPAYVDVDERTLTMSPSAFDRAANASNIKLVDRHVGAALRARGYGNVSVTPASFPRRRESSVSSLQRRWVPACVGTTTVAMVRAATSPGEFTQ